MLKESEVLEPRRKEISQRISFRGFFENNAWDSAGMAWEVWGMFFSFLLLLGSCLGCVWQGVSIRYHMSWVFAQWGGWRGYGMSLSQ